MVLWLCASRIFMGSMFFTLLFEFSHTTSFTGAKTGFQKAAAAFSSGSAGGGGGVGNACVGVFVNAASEMREIFFILHVICLAAAALWQPHLACASRRSDSGWAFASVMQGVCHLDRLQAGCAWLQEQDSPCRSLCVRPSVEV